MKHEYIHDLLYDGKSFNKEHHGEPSTFQYHQSEKFMRIYMFEVFCNSHLLMDSATVLK